MAGIDVAGARAGESVRIIHALDAVEAMAKVEGVGSVYSGFLGSAVAAGRGTTKKLTGMLILSTTEFREGFRRAMLEFPVNNDAL